MVSSTPQKANRLILAIDDDSMVHKLLEFSLKDFEFPVRTVSSAQQGQDILSFEKKDVLAIILDWEMPGMNGLEFLRWLKSNRKFREIPVIMLTGKNAKEDIKIGIDSGAYYYVTKPFNKDFLRSILNAAINDYQQVLHLKSQVEDARYPFSTLIDATFHIRTMEEAQRLSVLIANATTNPEENLIICELMNNAIEHGNLGIKYEEKSKLVDNNTLHTEINRRLMLPENKGKYAEISFKKNDEHLIITIKDQGKGFNYKRYLTFDEKRVFDNHGRGIAMANSLLDIKYIGKGNKVRVNIPLLSVNDSTHN